ncbi:hypothetical protein HPHPA20_0222 [Helicobacter pylori Hp A-20]|nr:hypothetical protein HPHPA20_0222 [Helicobacter pylori Hp A-20]
MGLKRALKRKIPPYFLMSLNKLNEFTIKWNPKRWNNALNPIF